MLIKSTGESVKFIESKAFSREFYRCRIIIIVVIRIIVIIII